MASEVVRLRGRRDRKRDSTSPDGKNRVERMSPMHPLRTSGCSVWVL